MLICGQMTLAMTSLLLACVFHCLCTFVLVSASRWLVEIWELIRGGDTGIGGGIQIPEMTSCKLSFLFPPHCQSALESLPQANFIIIVYFF